MKVFPIPIKKFSLIFILFVFLIFLFQINSSDGFKLRDFKQISEKRSDTIRRKENGIPLRKIEKVFHDSYDDDDDDDDIMIDIESAEEVQDDDDDDDDEDINILQDDDEDDDADDDGNDDGDDSEEISLPMRKPYVFQKVRKSTVSHHDDDDDDDDDHDQVSNDDEDDDNKNDNEDDDGNIQEDDDDDGGEVESKYVFQKVRRRPYNVEPDTYISRSKRKFEEIDDEDDDEVKENIITATIASWINFVKDSFAIIPETINEKKELFTAWLKEKRATEEVVEREPPRHIDKEKIKPRKQEDSTIKIEKDEEEEEEEVEIDNERSKRGFLSWMSTLKEKFTASKDNKEEIEEEEEEIMDEIVKPTKQETNSYPKSKVSKEPEISEQTSTVSHLKTEAKEFMSLIKETSSSLLNSLMTPEGGSGDGQPSLVDKILDTEKSKANDQKQKREKKKETRALEQFDQLLLNLPSFVPNYTNVHNQNCINQGQLFQRQLRNQKHWALQMMDASAKIPAGLLRGNVNQLGDFDLCTDILSKIQINNDKKMKMRGKYCLAHVDVTAVHNDLRLPVYLMQGRSFLRSSLKDPSHFLPRFTTFNWGICLPSGCDHNDVTRIIEDGLRPYNSTGIRLYVKVGEENCHVKRRIDYFALVKNNWQIAGTITYYLAVIMLVVLASLNDYWLDWKSNLNKNKKEADKVEEAPNPETEGTMNQILMSFSLKRTVKVLLENPSEKSSEIECIHGIKTIATIMMYFAFKLIPLATVPFTNRIYFTEFFNSPFSVFIRAAIMYADVFLLISGILSAYTVSIRVGHQGSVNWFKRLVGRIIRLTPALLAVLLYYAWVWEYTGSGPLWGDLVKNNAEICKRNLWQNILYIQNWFPFSQTCATHTNQLGIDMQFYLISPLIIYLLHKTPAVGLGMFGILHGISAAMRYSATLNNRLSPVIFHGMKLSQFYRTADLSFNAPLHRATPYFTGVGLGFILSQIQTDVKLPKGVIITGWVSSIWAILWCFWTSSHLALKNYQYDPVEAAAYNAWSPLIWSLSLCWIVFACFSGNGNKLNKVLGSRVMRIFNKISYSIFLIEFLVFFYKAASIRHSTQFNFANSMFDWNEISITIGAATIVTLSFDLPFQSIKRILLTPSTNLTEDSRDGGPENDSAILAKNTSVNGTTINHEPDFISPFGDDDEEEDYVPKTQTKNQTADGNLSSNYLMDIGKSEVVQNIWDDEEEGFWGEEENDDVEPKSESNHVGGYKMKGPELKNDSESEDEGDSDVDEDEESDEGEEDVSEIEIKLRPVASPTGYRWNVQED